MKAKCKGRKRPVEVQLTIRIPADLHRAFKVSAVHQEKSMVVIIEKLIREFLKKKRGK